MSPLIRQVTQEYCKARGITKHADWLEKEVRNSRDMLPSKPLNKTVQTVLNMYIKRCEKV